MKGGTFRNVLVLRTARGRVIGKAGRFAVVGKRALGVRRTAEVRAKAVGGPSRASDCDDLVGDTGFEPVTSSV